jgi:predicted metal-dependent phosphoesterase TrpH
VSKVDLHLHSTASDGRFSPAEVVRKSTEAGLSVISLTDHDTVDGIAPALEAAREYPQLRVIPGVEINTDVPSGEAHVLGYFIDYTNQGLNDSLERLRQSRQIRAKGMIAKLGKLGIHIDWARIQEIAGSASIGRPHIAQALLEKGYINSFREAFTKYIGREGSAYVAREKIAQVEAVALILRAKGLPVLAHPLTLKDAETMLTQLKAAGLVGLEAYYNNYTAEEIDRLVQLAKRYGLITTGGSDYHGIDAANETVIGGADVPIESAKQLIALAGERALKSTSP